MMTIPIKNIITWVPVGCFSIIQRKELCGKYIANPTYENIIALAIEYHHHKNTIQRVLKEENLLAGRAFKNIVKNIPIAPSVIEPTAQEIEHTNMILSLQINGIFTDKHLNTTLNAVRCLLKAFQEDSHYLFNPSISQKKEITSLFKDTKLTKENDARLEANYQRAIKNGRPIKDMTPTNVNKVQKI